MKKLPLKKLTLKKLSKKTKILIGCAVALVAVGVALAVTRSVIAKSKVTGEIYKVRKEVSEDVIDISGNVSAANEQTLQAKNSGAVMKVYVKEGDRVKKGQMILQLDDSTQQYDLASLDYQIAQKQINGSAKEIQLMKKQREALVQKVEDRKVVATFDGIIASLEAAEGDYFEAKDVIGTLVDTSYLKAKVEVVETDVSRLKVGQKVDFSFPAYSEGTVSGYLHSFPSIGEITSRGVTVVNAEVRIKEFPPEILPNFSFSGKIQISEPINLLVVERNAIGYDNGKTHVEIIRKDGSSEIRDVKVKPYGMNYVTVLEGLEGGERLKQLSASSISGKMKDRKTGAANKPSQQGNSQKAFGGAPGPMMPPIR